MIENKFLHFFTQQTFEQQLAEGKISQTSIAFIDQNDAGLPTIWTHGVYYCACGGNCSDVTEAINDIYSLIAELRDLINGGSQDRLIEITWSGGNLGKSILAANEQTAFNKGTVYAIYESGNSVDITDSAEFYASGGTLSSNSYTAPNTGGQYIIGVRYGGKEASAKLTVTVNAVAKKNIEVGSGTSLNNVNFVNTGKQFVSGMVQAITISHDADYIFIKADSNDNVESIEVANSPITQIFNLTLIDTANGYKYYKTNSRFGTEGGAETEQFVIH